ncbi:Fic family protein [Nonomuraea endophytica]|uniref:Fic family protein n=1 Tax=Nonomuraea endophytica TaxID=714136 RepID=UPI0037CA7261
MKSTSQHPYIYAAPPLAREDRDVLSEIHAMRRELRHVLKTPKRWQGGLRRSALARAIRGSNSIEGYVVAEDDAAAAVDGGEPIAADQQTFLEIEGYRDALGYVLARSGEDVASFDETEIRAMHFMMLRHDPAKSPGSYRKGPVFVHDDRRDLRVYEGPDAGSVPALMGALVESLNAEPDTDPIVRSALAHLNLVMIHPFRDGNGRMARALATSVLTRSEIGEPEFSSIEEWLGANTDDYYAALAITGKGSWQPRPDAHLWVSFNLRAHHMQAQTVAQRVKEAGTTWVALDALTTEHGLPERVMDAMFDAVLGYRLRRSGYAKRADIEEHTATRDLTSLTKMGLLVAHGTGRARYYTAGPLIQEVQQARRNRRRPLTDPYPWMRQRLADPAVEDSSTTP